MAAMLGRTQVQVKDTSTSTTVPNNHIARLMYYFNCVCSCIEPDDSSEIRRLRDYQNYHHLTSEEELKLIVFCLALSPDKLIGSIFFPGDCGSHSNKFLELSAVSTRMVVSESLIVGGQSRKVQSIMICERSWIERNYIEPFCTIERNRISRPSPTRALPAPRPSPPPCRNDDSCVIL